MGLSKPIIITSSAVDTSNLATKSDIDSIKNSVGAVKSVQRGSAKLTSSTGNYIDVTISEVNMTKTLVVVESSVTNDEATSASDKPVVGFLQSATNLRLACTTYNQNLHWQVIEFK